MCRITLIPIVKPFVQNEPHPQTTLFGAKPNDEVLSPVELHLNDQYLNSHGLPPEQAIHFPASSDWPAHVTPIGGPYPPSYLQPSTAQYTSTVITFQQQYGFVPGCPSQALYTSALPATAFGTQQHPYLLSACPCYPMLQYYSEKLVSPLKDSAKNGTKPLFPALVPDRVVPRSQHNLSPVKVPSNYGVKAYYCDMVFTQYQIYHTQRLREAEPEPRKMPHLCAFEYGAGGNVFWQDGRHVEEGEAGKVMGPESYIDGLMAEEAKAEEVHIKPDKGIGKRSVNHAPVERPIPAVAPEVRRVSSSFHDFTQPGKPYSELLSSHSLTQGLTRNGCSSANHLAPGQPQRRPSPRYVPAEHEILPTSQDEVTAAIKKLIGVDEHWNPVERLAQTRQNSKFTETGPESKTIECADGRVSSAPYEKRSKASEWRLRGRGQGKATIRKAFRRGQKAATHLRPELMQYASYPQHPPTWHQPATLPLAPSLPLATDYPPPFQAPVANHSAAYIYSPTLPNARNTPEDLGFSNLSLNQDNLTLVLDPVPPKLPEPASLSHASSSLARSKPACFQPPLPERPMSCLPPLDTDHELETARHGLGTRLSRASTTSLPCDLWIAEPKSETPSTPWTATLVDRTKAEAGQKGK